MVETTVDENEINSLIENRNWRKTKAILKKRGSRLTPQVSYALGCRGHPGLVIESNYWDGWSFGNLMGCDVTIKSLVDGIEENCSLFSCAPMPISKQEAEKRLHDIQTKHAFDISIEYGYPVEKVKEWCQSWVDEGVLYYVLHEQDGKTVQSTQAFNKTDADQQIVRLKRFQNADILLAKEVSGITNPRMVDMLTYPAPIKSFDIIIPKDDDNA